MCRDFLKSHSIGLSLDVDTLSSFVSSFSSVLWTLYHPRIRAVRGNNSFCPFFINGHLHVDYVQLSGWLGLPPCSSTHAMASHPSEAGDPRHQVSGMVLWSGVFMFIIIHRTCTCIVQMKMGTATLLAKKLGMEDLYLHMLGTRLEGWQPVL